MSTLVYGQQYKQNSLQLAQCDSKVEQRDLPRETYMRNYSSCNCPHEVVVDHAAKYPANWTKIFRNTAQNPASLPSRASTYPAERKKLRH